MKVQRAPRVAQQPQPEPPGEQRARSAVRQPYGASGVLEGHRSSTGSSATIDVDVTSLHGRTDVGTVTDELVRHLLFACRHEGVVDNDAEAASAKLTADGLAMSDGSPSEPSGALLVVLSQRAGLAATGDWGLTSGAVATLGPVAPVLSSGEGGLTVERRQVVRISLTAATAAAFRVVRALDIVAEAIEERR